MWSVQEHVASLPEGAHQAGSPRDIGYPVLSRADARQPLVFLRSSARRQALFPHATLDHTSIRDRCQESDSRGQPCSPEREGLGLCRRRRTAASCEKDPARSSPPECRRHSWQADPRHPRRPCRHLSHGGARPRQCISGRGLPLWESPGPRQGTGHSLSGPARRARRPKLPRPSGQCLPRARPPPASQRECVCTGGAMRSPSNGSARVQAHSV